MPNNGNAAPQLTNEAQQSSKMLIGDSAKRLQASGARGVTLDNLIEDLNNVYEWGLRELRVRVRTSHDSEIRAYEHGAMVGLGLMIDRVEDLVATWQQRVKQEQRAGVDRPTDVSCVICPKCTHQFRAIPEQVQGLLTQAGYAPPFYSDIRAVPNRPHIHDRDTLLQFIEGIQTSGSEHDHRTLVTTDVQTLRGAIRKLDVTSNKVEAVAECHTGDELRAHAESTAHGDAFVKIRNRVLRSAIASEFAFGVRKGQEQVQRVEAELSPATTIEDFDERRNAAHGKEGAAIYVTTKVLNELLNRTYANGVRDSSENAIDQIKARLARLGEHK